MAAKTTTDMESQDGEMTPGRGNIIVSWWLIALGMAAGAVLGLWSFGGPVAPPSGFGSYDDPPRRLLRLAHIAVIALPVVNLHYVPWIRRTGWSDGIRAVGCRLLLAGTLLLPSLLAVSAFWLPARYALPLPVTGLIASVVLLAAGLRRPIRGRSRRVPSAASPAWADVSEGRPCASASSR